MPTQLYTTEQVIKMINEGRTLLLSGDESQLAKLPNGNWVGGTIPYFMTKEGGTFTKELIYVNDITNEIINYNIKVYNKDNIHNIIKDSYTNGFSYIMMPALTDVLAQYALESPEWKDIYVNPIIGWISGVQYEDFGKKKPKTFSGNKSYDNAAVVLHAELPKNKVARIEIINVYEQGEGDEIYFNERGFGNNECLINGKTHNLYEYLNEQKINETLPLVADYAGANINVGSIWNKDTRRADLFAPVFPDTVYKVAKSRDFNYVKEFKEKLSHDAEANIAFSCNCLFNYVNFGLEGKNIANVSGPVTFGEIAYHVLNQTFVYLVIE